MNDSISRRDFLKLSGAAAAGALLRPFPPEEAAELFRRKPAYRLGRTVQWLHYYERPSTQSRQLGFYNTDAVVEIYEEARGEPNPAHNPVWLRTEKGWLQSSFVQPVGRRFNPPVFDIPEGGFLAEVTVPYTPVYDLSQRGGFRNVYRFYYASTHWVLDMETDETGFVWYRVLDDLNQRLYYVPAEHLRRIPAEELAPLSPGVPGKRIEIDLQNQRLAAYEGSRQVLEAGIATGLSAGATPTGEFFVERKRPSRHMAAASRGPGFYDLPGVPWVCFILWTGVSTHGTYWHNDYGRPRSHGCINLTPEDARWVYRWTEPVVPPEEDFLKSESGTTVVVF